MDNPLNLSFTPFVQHLGVELVQVEKGHAEIRLTLKPHQENGLEAAHGGVIMTLMDVVMALAAKSSDPDGLGVVTIEMKTSFLRPARGEIHAFGWCDHYSATMAFCKAECRDTHGRVLAQGMGTFKRMRTLARRRKNNSN